MCRETAVVTCRHSRGMPTPDEGRRGGHCAPSDVHRFAMALHPEPRHECECEVGPILSLLELHFRPKGPAIPIAQPIGLGPGTINERKAQGVGNSVFMDFGKDRRMNSGRKLLMLGSSQAIQSASAIMVPTVIHAAVHNLSTRRFFLPQRRKGRKDGKARFS